LQLYGRPDAPVRQTGYHLKHLDSGVAFAPKFFEKADQETDEFFRRLHGQIENHFPSRAPCGRHLMGFKLDA
jgi:hypothetical protein